MMAGGTVGPGGGSHANPRDVSRARGGDGCGGASVVDRGPPCRDVTNRIRPALASAIARYGVRGL